MKIKRKKQRKNTSGMLFPKKKKSLQALHASKREEQEIKE